MSYLGVGISPGNVPVSHVSNLKVIDRRVRITELVLRVLICAFAVIAIGLIVSDTQVKEFFTIRKEAKFSDVKAVVFLVIANAIAAAYTLAQIVRCIASMIKGSVLFNKPLAWAIFSGDQLTAYLIFAAVSASAESSIIAKFGEPGVQWMKVCNLYAKFCNQAAQGFACAVIVCICVVALSALSAFSLFRLYGHNKSKNRSTW